MRNICFLSGDITRSGGTEKVACQIASGLADKFNVSIISLCESGNMFYSLPERIKHEALFAKNPNGVKQYFSIVGRIRKYLRKNKIDILIDIDSILDMFSVSAVAFSKVKLISWEHFNFFESMGNSLRVPIRKHITKYADCVVTLTKEDRDTFVRQIGKKCIIRQIYNPIEFGQKTEYDINSKTLISVGRLAHQKGFDILLDVAKTVLDKQPEWEWLILGEGDERENLEKIIADKNIKNVKLIGKVENVGEYLQKSSIFVMTSRYEGFPLALIEAKAAGLPVVSFKCKTGPAELVKEGVNGYLTDCFDTEQMINQILILIEDTELRKKFADNALIDTEKMNYEDILSDWEGLIDEY